MLVYLHVCHLKETKAISRVAPIPGHSPIWDPSEALSMRPRVVVSPWHVQLGLREKESSSFRHPRNQGIWTPCLATDWSIELYGDGSKPINTIFRGMNIHLPAILMFTRGTRFWHTAISKPAYFLLDTWLVDIRQHELRSRSLCAASQLVQ